MLDAGCGGMVLGLACLLGRERPLVLRTLSLSCPASRDWFFSCQRLEGTYVLVFARGYCTWDSWEMGRCERKKGWGR
jgi:hypothetical protein